MIKIYVVDAFVTNTSFSGNPAGVCILKNWQSESWMQNIAAEMNHSETAFIVKNESGFGIRYFTPTIEVPLCGHATLATAFILWKENIVPKQNNITFYAKGGILKAQKEKNYIKMDFPSSPAKEIQNFDKNILTNLSIDPIFVYQSNNDIIYELSSHEKVRSYTPDFHSMNSIPYRMHIITAKNTLPDSHFISRVFAPTAGVNEDSATGVAHCILGPLWGRKLDLSILKAYQASSRGAEFNITLSKDRVLLSGKCLLVLKGDLYCT
jgi:PhzF family phenazine biosynthesis protein